MVNLVDAADGMLSLSRRLTQAGVAGTVTPELVAGAKLNMLASHMVLLEQKHGQHAAADVLRAAELLDPSTTRLNQAIRALNEGATFLQTRAMYRGTFG